MPDTQKTGAGSVWIVGHRFEREEGGLENPLLQPLTTEVLVGSQLARHEKELAL